VSVNRFSPENPLCSGRTNRRKSCAAPPPPSPCIGRVQDFVADFARAGKSFTEKNKNAYSPNLHGSGRLFLIKKAKMGAGRPEPVPGQHQERLGGGRHVTDRPRLYRRIQKLAEAVQGHMVRPLGRLWHCPPVQEPMVDPPGRLWHYPLGQGHMVHPARRL
jgi:hypothetical protein